EWTASSGVMAIRQRRDAKTNHDMPAIGITGGISTGKTSFTECLREIFAERTPQRGVPTTAKFFDADAAARELADSDPEVRGLIESEFGAEVYSASEGLNRER